MKKKATANLVVFYLLIAVMFVTGTLLGNRIVSVIAENQPIHRTHTLVIDPGHGGEDGGATSCTGKNECIYNLNISLRLRDMLNLLGYNTVMIRTTDTAVYIRGNTIAEKKSSDLKERVRIANQSAGNMLLSIHQNNFSDEKYSGAQVFYSSNPVSMELAEQIQQAFVSTLNPGSNRKTKRGEGIYILEKTKCPAVLIECGFLSNYQEESKLSSPEYQKSIACVISSTVSTFIANT